MRYGLRALTNSRPKQKSERYEMRKPQFLLLKTENGRGIDRI